MAADRQTEFLCSRLATMGIEVGAGREGATSATGTIPLAAVPFETLSEEFVASTARFYTLGHSRLKFFDPLPFFRLPPIDASDCESAADLETALRRAWTNHLRQVSVAAAWLERLGASARRSQAGSRLELQLGESPAEVLACDEMLLPSTGPLCDARLSRPADRRHRPLRSLESASDLELHLAQAMERVGAATCRPTIPGERLSATREVVVPPPPERPETPVLLVIADATERASAVRCLQARGVSPEATSDPLRALEALRQRSFAAAVVDAHLQRTDGVELMMRLGEQPGMGAMPVLILDDRDTERVRGAADAAGAAGYLVRPLEWDVVGETLLDVVDHWSKRRYRRFTTRLGVSIESETSSATEIGEEVGRGGMRVSSRRTPAPGAIERYGIYVPGPHPPVLVDGQVVYREPLPGSALATVGVRFVRFLDESERRWIELLESLAKRR